ncbi:hypothetical protein F4678DRAFT_415390 [Xylaria arbuscula]|nr:hypothetical protein F4678DRAFT_415390 [Xylaria arbuscula]
MRDYVGNPSRLDAYVLNTPTSTEFGLVRPMESDFIQYQSFGNGVRLHLITTIFICPSTVGICLPATPILFYTILVPANLASVSIIIIIIVIITLCISPALPCPPFHRLFSLSFILHALSTYYPFRFSTHP